MTIRVRSHFTIVIIICSFDVCRRLNVNSTLQIKRVVIETTGVCDVTMLRLLRYTLIKLAIHRSFFPKRSGRSHWCLYRHQLMVPIVGDVTITSAIAQLE